MGFGLKTGYPRNDLPGDARTQERITTATSRLLGGGALLLLGVALGTGNAQAQVATQAIEIASGSGQPGLCSDPEEREEWNTLNPNNIKNKAASEIEDEITEHGGVIIEGDVSSKKGLKNWPKDEVDLTSLENNQRCVVIEGGIHQEQAFKGGISFGNINNGVEAGVVVEGNIKEQQAFKDSISFQNVTGDSRAGVLITGNIAGKQAFEGGIEFGGIDGSEAGVVIGGDITGNQAFQKGSEFGNINNGSHAGILILGSISGKQAFGPSGNYSLKFQNVTGDSTAGVFVTGNIAKQAFKEGIEFNGIDGSEAGVVIGGNITGNEAFHKGSEFGNINNGSHAGILILGSISGKKAFGPSGNYSLKFQNVKSDSRAGLVVDGAITGDEAFKEEIYFGQIDSSEAGIVTGTIEGDQTFQKGVQYNSGIKSGSEVGVLVEGNLSGPRLFQDLGVNFGSGNDIQNDSKARVIIDGNIANGASAFSGDILWGGNLTTDSEGSINVCGNIEAEASAFEGDIEWRGNLNSGEADINVNQDIEGRAFNGESIGFNVDLDSGKAGVVVGRTIDEDKAFNTQINMPGGVCIDGVCYDRLEDIKDDYDIFEQGGRIGSGKPNQGADCKMFEVLDSDDWMHDLRNGNFLEDLRGGGQAGSWQYK